MRYLLLLTALGTLLLGCSSTDGDPEPSLDQLVDVPTEAELLETVSVQKHAVIRGDAATAYELLSQRCRDQVDLDEFETGVVVEASLIWEATGAEPDEIDFTNIDVVEFSDTEAVVSGNYSAESDDGTDQGTDVETDSWVFEDGWRLDEC